MCTFNWFIVSILIFIHSMLQFLLTFVEQFCVAKRVIKVYTDEKFKFCFHDSLYFFSGLFRFCFDIGFLWFCFITVSFVSTRTFSLSYNFILLFLDQKNFTILCFKKSKLSPVTPKRICLFLLFTRFRPNRLKKLHVLCVS